MIVDDQEILRRGLRMLLELEPDIEVVGEAEDGRRALAAMPESSPDVVLVDARMPVLDGIGFTERCARDHPEARVLALTTFDDTELVRAMLDAGAAGFLLKDVSTSGLREAILQVMRGGTVVDPRVVRTVIDRPAGDGLTPTERAVAGLVAEGCSNRVIAERLHLAHGTVKNTVSALLRKFGVRDRTALALHLAREQRPGEKRGG
nr:response regulator transcription factor [Leucobacter ruminantium]